MMHLLDTFFTPQTLLRLKALLAESLVENYTQRAPHTYFYGFQVCVAKNWKYMVTGQLTYVGGLTECFG
jgi:hypothetical protein